MGEHSRTVATQGRMARVVTDVVAEAVEVLRLGSPPEQALLHVATRLGEAVRADAVCVGSLDQRSASCDFSTAPADVDTAPLREAALRRPHEHPVLHHWLTGHQEVATVSSLGADRAAWRASATYDALRGCLGCTETGGIRLDRGTPRLRMIGFARDGDFTAAEVDLLRLARRPVVAVAEHAWWLAGLRAASPPTPRTPVQHDPAHDEAGLTGRERQVLELLAQGLTAASIGRRLVVSERTVHRHLSHVYAKLDTHDRLGTVIRAQQLGLVTPEPLGRTTHGRTPAPAAS